MFWSMFACDMERVLAEQPPDTWDSFPLFQVLNDYLRTDGREIKKIYFQNLKFLTFRQSQEWPLSSSAADNFRSTCGEIC